MYIQFLLGLGGWVGAAPDDEAPPPHALRGHATERAPAGEPPRTACPTGHLPRGRSRKVPGLRR